MHILFLDKDISFLKLAESALEAETFTYIGFNDPVALSDDLENIIEVEPNVVVVSQSFFESSKINLLSYFKSRWANVRIIGIADLPGAKHRIKLLERGADDCLTKPIDFVELFLRIKKLSSRKPYLLEYPANNLGNLFLDESLKDCLVFDKRLYLNHHEYLLAENFISHPKKTFSRFTLLDLVWNRNSELESNSLEATISSLRKKMKTAGANVYLKSRRNIGYWLDVSE